MLSTDERPTLSRSLSGDRRKFLMGFAILFIIVYHVFYYLSQTYDDLPYRFWLFNNFAKDGYIGVDIFLFLSAYGLCHSYQRNTILMFYYNRVLRILPVYLGFAVLFTIFFMGHLDLKDTVKVWLYQLTGLYNLGVERIMIVEWFTPALILMYALFPLLYRIVGTTVRHRWLLVALIVVLSLFADILSLHFEGALFGRLSVILLGVMTFFILDSEGDDRTLWPLFLVCALICLVAPYRIAALSSLVPLMLMGFSRVRLCDNAVVRSVTFLGTYTFEIYLAQQLALSHVMRRMGPDLALWLNVTVCLLITLVLAVIFHFTGKSVIFAIEKFRLFFDKSLDLS